MSKPLFWSTPFRYMRWAANERPVLFYSVLITAITPLTVPIVPRVRHLLGDTDPAPIPLTYPIPRGPRKMPEGYNDP